MAGGKSKQIGTDGAAAMGESLAASSGGDRARGVGDCFVVHACDGRFWGPNGWVHNWEEADLFGQPPDPYALCRQLADQIRQQTGVPCSPAYIPARSANLRLRGPRLVRRSPSSA